MKSKKLKLGIIGGGPNSWIGHVHRISSRFDDKYEIVAGVFSRNSKQSTKFGKSIGVSEDRCYSNYLTMARGRWLPSLFCIQWIIKCRWVLRS